MNKGQRGQVEEKRAHLRATIRQIHHLITSLPSHADGAAAEVVERVKRAKATALNDIAMELNRQEIKDIQSRTHNGGEGTSYISLCLELVDEYLLRNCSV
jgi:formate dehydrogenase maturation protein FdhE